MQRVVIFGPGGAGKTRQARELGARTRLPVTELDQVFWDERLEPLPISEWRERQRALAEADAWILDGDLGPYDDPEPRLSRADTIVVLDQPRRVCLWRSLRRGRERRDYWRWILQWRRDSRPKLMDAITCSASEADVVVLRNRRAVAEWVHETSV